LAKGIEQLADGASGLRIGRGAALVALVASFIVPASEPAAAGRPAESRIAMLERVVIDAPENLRVCADYRQLIIQAGEFDRSIKLLERLSARPAAGPNVYISLALAYVDKVPVVSPFRRIFLGRDATRALSEAIARDPSPVAYYIRGLVALYYPESVFHRARVGIADLEHAHEMLADSAPHGSHARVYMSLGDGYWKIHDLPRAIAIWTEGLSRFPANPNLRARLNIHGAELDQFVERALDPAFRVDTSLQELFDEKSDP
jgi:hypothetical protein